MAFTENWMLAKVFTHEAEDRESMGKGTEYIVCILLYSLCALLASRGPEPFRDSLRSQLQWRNEIAVSVVILIT
jgi:hypothetical protein